MQINYGTSRRETETERVAVGTTPTLTNLPCNVKITVQMENFEPIEVIAENENEARNILARFVPKQIIAQNSALVMAHLTDDLNPLFTAMLTEAKRQGLSLPTGL